MRPLRLVALAFPVLLLGGCLFGSPSGSATPSPTASIAPSGAPAASAAPPSGSGAPTPGLDAVPTFTAGSKIATKAAGLRVRSGPGTKQGVVTQLPVGAHLVVELGPVRADGHGWYLVRDADAAAPTFKDGWVAAGFMPTPYLAPAAFDLPFNPIIAGFAHEGNGEFGPVPISGANYTVTWAAAVLTGGTSCSFSVDLVGGNGTPVPAIRATLGTAPAPGNLYGDFFAAHPELTGDLIVRVTSDCSWALTFLSTAALGL